MTDTEATNIFPVLYPDALFELGLFYIPAGETWAFPTPVRVHIFAPQGYEAATAIKTYGPPMFLTGIEGYRYLIGFPDA
jgi:hypothetical protein